MKFLGNVAWAAFLAQVLAAPAAFGFQTVVDVPCRVVVSQGAQADGVDLATGLMKRGTTLLAGTIARTDPAIATSANACMFGRLAQGIRAATTTAPAVRPNSRWIAADLNGDGRADSIVLGGDNSYTRQMGGSGGADAPVRVTLGTSRHGLKFGSAFDVNQDGIPDLIACCASPGENPRLVVAIGNGDGTFQDPKDAVPGSEAFAVVDWNKDGVLDIVSASQGTLYISLGKNDGTFAVAQSTLNANGNNVVSADVSGDGLLDAIVIANRGVRMFAGVESGSVGQPVEIAVPLDSVNYAIVADFSGDGRPDLFVAQPTGGAAMLLGNGQGAFTVTGSFGVGHFETADATDVPGQAGKVLVLPDETTASLQLVPVTQAGVPIASPLYRVPDGPDVFADHSLTRSNMAIADFNADGKDDIAMVVPVGNTAILQVYRGRAVRDPVPADPITIVPLTSGALRIAIQDVAAADFDYDGWADVLVLDSESQVLLLYINDKHGSFRAPLVTQLSGATRSMVVNEFNNDNYPDVALANGPDTPGNGKILVYYGAPSGVFGNVQTITTGVTPHRLLAADLNADFRMDLAYLPLSPAGSNLPLGIVLNRTSNQFLTPTTLVLPAYSSIGGSQTLDTLAARDVNADGLVDLVIGIPFTDGGVKVFRGDGKGGFAPQPAIPNSPSTTAMLRLQDFNNDLSMDILAVHCCTDKTTQIYYGRGDGTFLAGRPLPTGGFSDRAWLADVDGDLQPELVAHTAAGTSLSPTLLPKKATILSAASGRGPALAADSIGSIYGSNLAVLTEIAPSGGVTPLGESNVAITDASGRVTDVPLFYSSPEQLNFLLPAGLAQGNATVTIVPSKGATSLADITISRIAPGLFVTDGEVPFVKANVIKAKADGTQTVQLPYELLGGFLRALPVDLGSPGDVVVLVLYGTGMRGRADLSQVSATIGGVSAPVAYAGAQGQFPGLDQINITIPRSLAGRGMVDVVVTVEGQASNIGRISIQ